MMKDMTESETADIRQKEENLESNEDIIGFSEATKKLAIGLLDIYQPPLEQVKKELDELTKKQETLICQMQLENKKFKETSEDIELNEMFATVKAYQTKLVLLKKEMALIHERTFRLKKRALKLQQIKQKEAFSKEQQREQELRREQELIGRPFT